MAQSDLVDKPIYLPNGKRRWLRRTSASPFFDHLVALPQLEMRGDAGHVLDGVRVEERDPYFLLRFRFNFATTFVIVRLLAEISSIDARISV